MLKTPIHLWIIGVVSLLWNAGGAADYVMSQFRVESYMAQLAPEHIAYIDAFPSWFEAVWAIGVWGAVLGSLLLLLRSRFAVQAFFLSLVGLLASSVYSFGIAEPSSLELMGTFALWFTVAIYVVTIMLLIYARAMRWRGVLR
jgi:cell shape-determining protein MreD